MPLSDDKKMMDDYLKSQQDSTNEAKNLANAIQQGLEIQKNLNKDSAEYFKYLKKVKDLTKTINKLKEEEIKIATRILKIREALETLNEDDKKVALTAIKNEKETLALLEKQRAELERSRKVIAEQLKDANQIKVIFKSTGDDLKAIGKGLKSVYNFLGISDVFKMTKAIKTSALQMGILSNQSKSFSQGIQAAALDTVQYGEGIQEIAKIQSTYSDELGRTVELGKEGAKALAAMAVSTGLGEEGAGKLAADFDMVGLSAKRTADYIEQTMNDSHELGLNSSKVIKTISSNVKLLNKYNFKDGIKGLAKMAESVTKMGVSMDLVAGMSDKIFDIEGAVEMSAQLQVLGGEWSKLADPFKLMYLARNDMEGLTNSIINATKASATFNKRTHEFDISALEMQRLRKVAEATGLNFEELAQSAKNAAKFAAIKKQISYTFDEKTTKFIESTAMLDEKGQAQIKVGATTKYLNALTDSDKSELQKYAAQKEDMETRAKESQTLDELWKNTVTMGKQLLIPLVSALNDKLYPIMDKLITRLKDPKLIDGIIKFSEGIANFVGGVANFVMKFPKISGAMVAALFGVFEIGKWYLNGLALGKGFNSVASAGGGGGIGGGGAANGKGSFMGLSKGGKLSTAMGGGIGGAVVGGLNALGSDSVGEGVGNVVGGIIGGAAGTLLDEFIGPYGTILGAQIGSWLGGKVGGLFAGGGNNANGEKQQVNPVQDGIIKFDQKDKFMKVNDSTMVAGTDKNGNKDLANAINGGNIPEIPNKNSLMNTAKRGNITPPVQMPPSPAALTINFGELKFGGSIELKMGQNGSPELGKQLLNTPGFIRDISKMIHMETASAVAGITQQRVNN